MSILISINFVCCLLVVNVHDDSDVCNVDRSGAASWRFHAVAAAAEGMRAGATATTL